MPTNANTFNSRVTSEALEKKFRDVFPAQGGAELVQDLYASGVVQPVIDFSSVAEGSVLAPNLQTAWDFSTGNAAVVNTTSTLINNTGFWLVNFTVDFNAAGDALFRITDGLGSKVIYAMSGAPTRQNDQGFDQFVVFLRAGDSLTAQSGVSGLTVRASWRQIADVNGNLVNPLGFVFS
jgi:hypothetical protein